MTDPANEKIEPLHQFCTGFWVVHGVLGVGSCPNNLHIAIDAKAGDAFLTFVCVQRLGNGLAALDGETRT